jgi:hypothetical protein
MEEAALTSATAIHFRKVQRNCKTVGLLATVRSLFIVTLSVAVGAIGTGLLGHIGTSHNDTALGASIVVGGSLFYYRLVRKEQL